MAAVFLGGLPLLTGGSLAVALCRVAVTAKQLLTLREVGFFRRMALSAVKQSVLADIVLHLRGGGCHVLQNIFDFTCHKLFHSIQVYSGLFCFIVLFFLLFSFLCVF